VMTIEVSKREGDSSHTMTKNFRKLTHSSSREEILSQQPTVMEAPGLPLIKRIELATKWRKHVPIEHQDEICPLCTVEEIETNKVARRRRKARRQEDAAANSAIEDPEPVENNIRNGEMGSVREESKEQSPEESAIDHNAAPIMPAIPPPPAQQINQQQAYLAQLNAMGAWYSMWGATNNTFNSNNHP